MRRLIKTLKDTCPMCKGEFSLVEMPKHKMQCPQALHKCRFCSDSSSFPNFPYSPPSSTSSSSKSSALPASTKANTTAKSMKKNELIQHCITCHSESLLEYCRVGGKPSSSDSSNTTCPPAVIAPTSVITGFTTIAITRRLGQTGKYYCGGPLTGPACACCDDKCGIHAGCNCRGCMAADLLARRIDNGNNNSSNSNNSKRNSNSSSQGDRYLINVDGVIALRKVGSAHFYCGRSGMVNHDGDCIHPVVEEDHKRGKRQGKGKGKDIKKGRWDEEEEEEDDEKEEEEDEDGEDESNDDESDEEEKADFDLLLPKFYTDNSNNEEEDNSVEIVKNNKVGNGDVEEEDEEFDDVTGGNCPACRKLDRQADTRYQGL